MANNNKKGMPLRSHTEDTHHFIARDEVERLLEAHEKRFKEIIQVQENSFKSCLQAIMESMHKRIDDFVINLTKDVQSTKDSLEFTQAKVETDIKEIESKLCWLKERYQHHEVVYGELSTDVKQLKTDVDYLENQSRRNNIRIDGVKEKHGENWDQTELVVKEILATHLNVAPENLEIERAHRVGKKEDQTRGNKSRTIVAKMLRYKDRAHIIRNSFKLKGTAYSINEDVSETIQLRRKELMPQLRAAKLQKKIAYFSMDRLVIKDRPPKPATTEPGVDAVEVADAVDDADADS